MKVKYCIQCDHFKPQRCHHCSVCNKCILLMDHHCPFIANCVGFKNHKYFLSYVMYAIIGILYVFSIFIWRITVTDRPLNWLEIVFMFIDAVLLLYFLFAMLSLCIEQICLVRRGTTHVDVWDKFWAESDAREEKKTFKYAYDLGIINNFREICGYNFLLWCWPIPRAGDGIHFKTNSTLQTSLETITITDDNEEQ